MSIVLSLQELFSMAQQIYLLNYDCDDRHYKAKMQQQIYEWLYEGDQVYIAKCKISKLNQEWQEYIRR